MKPEPELDRAALVERIHQEYGFPVVRLERFPEGTVGLHYIADCDDGERYFVTLYDGSRLAQINARKLDFTLPLTRTLYDSGLFTSLAPPLVTLQGELRGEFEGWPLVVCPYQEGSLLENVPEKAAFQSQLAGLVAGLHACTPHLQVELSLREQFILPFEPALHQRLQMLEAITPQDRWGRVALRELLLPGRDHILELLERTHTLAQAVRQAPPPFVLCHTDIHEANVLCTPQGRLVVVDWEGACLAPAEHDLFIFSGPGFAEFLRAYQRAGGVSRLSAGMFAYYFHRRNLEDLTDCLVEILDENAGRAEDQSDLEGMQECVDGWPDLETSLGHMQAILDHL